MQKCKISKQQRFKKQTKKKNQTDERWIMEDSFRLGWHKQSETIKVINMEGIA